MIVGRERHFHIALLAGLGADQLILEAGNELARAQREIEILALAAVEFHAVDAADEIDHDDVVLLRRLRLRAGRR